MPRSHTPVSPAFHIPLTDTELKTLGDICAIQGQIEKLMYDTVIYLLRVSLTTADHIMGSTQLDAKGQIWLGVIRDRCRDPAITTTAAEAYDELNRLSRGRNDFVHAFFAQIVRVSISGITGPRDSILYSTTPDTAVSGPTVAIRTRRRTQRMVSEIGTFRVLSQLCLKNFFKSMMGSLPRQRR
jgi:hypothetical protein